MAYPRPEFDIAEIVRDHRPALEAQVCLHHEQRRMLTAISLCRTAALGGHLETCEKGDYQRNAYNSCRNRHCMKCQALAQERWIAAREKRLLNVGHFHGVFTLPSELRPLAKGHPAAVYGAFFRAVTTTLLALGQTQMGVTLGLTMVLHTWTRELGLHPHIHVLITDGGLALDGHSYRKTKHNYLFPFAMMAGVFRAKMLEELGLLQTAGAFPEFSSGAYGALMAPLAKKPWIAYAKKPFRRSAYVVAYLGRYTHRVGISNARIKSYTPEQVTFGTKHGLTATLHPVAFLRRLVQHVLPPGFHKIRHAGLYSLVRPGGLLEQAKAFVGAYRRPKKTLSLCEKLERAARFCPVCGGELHRTPLPKAPKPQPPSRAPPPSHPPLFATL